MTLLPRRSGAADPLTTRLVVVAWVCLSTALLGHSRGVDRSWPVAQARGSSLAARGCLHGRSASPEQWRSIAGVGKRLAVGLAEHCRHAPCTAAHPPQGVPGLGPVLGERVAQMLCAELPAAASPSAATAKQLVAASAGPP